MQWTDITRAHVQVPKWPIFKVCGPNGPQKSWRTSFEDYRTTYRTRFVRHRTLFNENLSMQMWDEWYWNCGSFLIQTENEFVGITTYREDSTELLVQLSTEIVNWMVVEPSFRSHPIDCAHITGGSTVQWEDWLDGGGTQHPLPSNQLNRFQLTPASSASLSAEHGQSLCSFPTYWRICVPRLHQWDIWQMWHTIAKAVHKRWNRMYTNSVKLMKKYWYQ